MQYRLQALGRRRRVDLNRQHVNARVRSRVIRPSSEVPGERRRSTTYFNCPRCGLSIAQSTHRRAITHRPQCAGRSRTIVALLRSRLPADLLYADSALPHATAVPAGRRHQRRWRVMRAPTTTPKSVELIRSATRGGRR
jgi:hypothetical protein